MFNKNGVVSNWVIQFNTEGVFFRTEGGNSLLKRNDVGVQPSMVQKHKHITDIGSHSHSASGSFITSSTGTYGDDWGNATANDYEAAYGGVSITSAYIGNKMSKDNIDYAEENTVKNRYKRIYIRIS